MKKILNILLVFMFLMAINLPLLMAEDVKSFSGEVGVGAYIQGDSDELYKAGEYYDDESSPTFNVDLNVDDGKNFFKAKGNYTGQNENDLDIKANIINRHLDIKFSHNKLFHRKPHNELYMQYDRNGDGSVWAINPFYADNGTLKGAQKVQFEDTQVGRDYYIRRSEEKAGLVISFPQLETLKFHFNGRYEKRTGYEQRTPMVGKCASCHVVGLTKKIDERTRDLKAGVSFSSGPLHISYSHLYRRFNVTDGTMTYHIDDAAPGTHQPVFRGRLYEYNTTGEVSKTPENKKHMDTVKVKLDLPNYTTFSTVFTNSNIENKDNSADLDQTTFGAKLSTHVLDRKLSLALKFRYVNIDSDDIFIDLPSNFIATDPAYDPGQSFDWTRKSAIDRDQYTINFDAVYRMLANRLKLRFGYQYDRIERDNFDVYNGEDTTESHKFKLGADYKVTSNFRAKFKFKYTTVDDPFANKGASCLATTPTASAIYPGNTAGAYPLIFNDSNRTYDGTASPDEKYEFNLDLSVNPSEKFMISFNGYYSTADNDNKGSDWDQDQYNLGLYATYMMNDKFSFSFGYNYAKLETETKLSVDLFGG